MTAHHKLVKSVDFDLFKAFDDETGSEIAHFKRVKGIWWWKSVKTSVFDACPSFIASDLEAKYQTYLEKMIVK